MVDAFVFERETAEHFPAQSLFIKLYAVERSADLVFRFKYLDIGFYFGIRRYFNSVGISDYYVQQFRNLRKEIFICDDDQLPAFTIRAEPSLIAFASTVVTAMHLCSALGTEDGRFQLVDIGTAVSSFLCVPTRLGALNCFIS